MSERSELFKRVLAAWDRGLEGRGYLEWLLRPEAANLDPGDVLREAVLDVIEEDEQLLELRRQSALKAVDKVAAGLSPEVAHAMQQMIEQIIDDVSQMAEHVRRKVDILRELRRTLGKDRLDTLQIVSEVLHSAPSEIDSVMMKFEVAEALTAKVTALSRASAEHIEADQEWREAAPDGGPFEAILRSRHEVGDGWFDYISEELDRYYSHQLPSRLSRIVERASGLEPVQLEVKNQAVKTLFHEAHEAFLYGFDVASIALCRSLVDHALRDRLSIQRNERPALRSMIYQAESNGLLAGVERESAERVEEAGNRIMHNLSHLRSNAQDVLVHTRIVLIKLYGNSADSAAASK